jgi:hypothetical protein
MSASIPIGHISVAAVKATLNVVLQTFGGVFLVHRGVFPPVVQKGLGG